jgi:hypothetical protein
MMPLGKALSTQYKDLLTAVAMTDFKSSSRLFKALSRRAYQSDNNNAERCRHLKI